MIKFSQLLTEISEELTKELSDAGVSLISEQEWNRDGGYWISTGAGHKLYTLRNDWNESYQFGEPDANGRMQTGTTRKSHWVINIGKSWSEVLKKLPAVLAKYNITKIYVPNYEANLDPNAAARDITFDENSTMVIGKKHVGKTVGWVKENDPSYLVYLATHITSGSYEVKKFAEYLKVLMAPEIKAQEESLTGDAIIPFGKYKGQKLSDIAKVNIGYIKWLANLNDNDRGYVPAMIDKQGQMLQQAAREFFKSDATIQAKEKNDEERATERAMRFAPLVEFMNERVQSTKEWEQTQNFYDEERGSFSGFLQQLTDQLAIGQIPRGKAAEIVIDNYAKWSGKKTRRGTKEYERKRLEFFDQFVKGDDEAAWGFTPQDIETSGQ
jgi:uncharacterized protein (DUF3820 family)